MAKTGKKKDADENNDAGATSVDESGDECGEGWWEAGKKGKQGKKVRFICKGGDEPCDKVISGKEKSIQCEACLEWYHPKCQDLSVEAFTAISTFQLLWICIDCRSRLSEILNMGKRVEVCIEKAEKRISKAVAENKKAAEEVEKKVQGQLKKMEEQVAKQLDSTSEDLKKVVKSKDELTERGNNLIIHGLQESVNNDAVQRMGDDKEKVMEIAKAVCGENVKLKIKGIIRLRGKQPQPDEVGKPRLMLVKFESKEDADKLFLERLRLKEAGYANVYINRDLTKDEREKQHKLRVELRQKGRETHRIFRGRVVPREQ